MEAKKDKCLPHSYAAFILINQLNVLFNIKKPVDYYVLSIENIKEAAKELLFQNTKELNRLGETAEGSI